MGTWDEWRARAREWKKHNRIVDADIAELVGVKRATVNHWLTGKREPGLRDFFNLCEAMGADPGAILFGHGSLSDSAKTGSETYRVLRADPAATQHHKQFVDKLRSFKEKKRRLRRAVMIK